MINNFNYILSNPDLSIKSDLNASQICSPNSNFNRNILNLSFDQEISLGTVFETPVAKQKSKILSIPQADCVFVTNGSTIRKINYDGTFDTNEDFSFYRDQGSKYRTIPMSAGDLCLINDHKENYAFAFSVLGCADNFFYATESSDHICPTSQQYNDYYNRDKLLSNSIIIVTGKSRPNLNTLAKTNPNGPLGVNTIQIDFGILPDKITYDFTRNKIFATNIYSPLSLNHNFKNTILPEYTTDYSLYKHLSKSGMVASVSLKHKDRGELVKEIYPTTYIDNIGPLPIGIHYDEYKDAIIVCNYGGKSIDILDPDTNQIVEQINNLGAGECGPTDVLSIGEDIYVSVANTSENSNVSKLLVLNKSNTTNQYEIKKSFDLSPGVIELNKTEDKVYATCYSGVSVINIKNLNAPVEDFLFTGQMSGYMGRSLCILKNKIFISATKTESDGKWRPYGEPSYYNGYNLPYEQQDQKVFLFNLPINASSSSYSSSSSSISRSSKSLSSKSEDINYKPILPSMSAISNSSSSLSSLTGGGGASSSSMISNLSSSLSSSSSKLSLSFNFSSASTIFQRKNTFNNYHIKHMFKRFAFTFGGIYEENSFNTLKRSVRDILNYLPCISSSSRAGGGGGSSSSSSIFCKDFDTLAGYKIEAIYVHRPVINSSMAICGSTSGVSSSLSSLVSSSSSRSSI